MANKIIVDVKTGEQTVVTLTPEEEADAMARTAAEEEEQAPIKAERAAQQTLRGEAKATAMFNTLKGATLTQIDNWVDNNFGTLTVAQRAFLKVLAASAALYLRERE